IDGGAHTLDICVAMTERRDEAYLMAQVVRTLSQTVEAPLVIDTTEAEVLEVALEAAPGRVIVNAVNMENGRQRLDAMLPLVRDYGAATIALTIDEHGMARTAERKIEVARTIYDIATREYGLLPDALIFDALTFTLATGDPESANTASETIEGIRRIKAELPGVLTSLGVSNVSYGFKPAGRWVLNSVFLYHAVQAGLDMAIVNPKQVSPYADIPAAQRELAEDLLFNRRPDATARFAAFYEGARARQASAADPTAKMSPAERLHWRVLHRQPDGCEADVDAVVAEGVREITGIANFTMQPGYHYPNPDTSGVAVRVLNQVLLPAMKEVGDRFGSGELILPFVLQSAEAMKRAVSHLERYLERSEGVSKGRVVLATVYGDVHDIGKNLIKTILANNGYSVHDLGKQVPANTVVDEAIALKADVIGLSALLVSTSRQMPIVVRELDRRGLAIPLLVGGAAINREFGRDITYIDERAYPGGVLYCRDAFEGLETVDRLVDPAARRDLLEGERRAADVRRLPVAADATDVTRSAVETRAGDVPEPPFWGPRTVPSIPLEEVFARLNETRLFKVAWGGGGPRGRGDTTAPAGARGAAARPEWKQLRTEFSERLARMKQDAAEQRWLAPAAVYGYFPAQSDGNHVVVFDPAEPARELVRFAFPRQRGGDRLCLADYFLPIGSEKMDVAALQVVTVGAAATERFDAMDGKHEYSEAYFSHGLAVQTAEAATELLFARIREELGLPQGRGVRFAWGYGALPDVEEHRKVFELLPAGRDLGMTLTSAGQLVPEQSTATLLVHHPAAHYFTT
ncbi:MAG TPA: dihydropteroate synthase, partial [Vicinamibacterales bacterium]|nr:dihydropteroate synthase [Vicinamibacterales bacterium]